MIAARSPDGGFLEALAATLLTAFVISAWLALGTLATGGVSDEDELALPLRLVIGSGITGFALAIVSAAGFVTGGVVLTGAICVVAVVARRDRVLATLRFGARAYSELRGAPILTAALAVTAALMWISAIAPPRSADAMRYHLAHIRLIVTEGRWSGIPDFHFALPFGWSLSFLPFELGRRSPQCSSGMGTPTSYTRTGSGRSIRVARR